MSYEIKYTKDKDGNRKRNHNHFTMGNQGNNPKTAHLYNRRGKKGGK